MNQVLIPLLLIVLSFNCIGQTVTELIEINHSITNTEELKGEIFSHSITSSFLKENRSFEVYIPPGYDTLNDIDVFFVTDQMCKYLAQIAEPMINQGKINPIVIVGINHRPKQEEDSIFDLYKPDYRGMDYHPTNIIFSEKNIPLKKVTEILQNRHEKFKNHVIVELIPFILANYKVSHNRLNWTLGGFSNGAAFALSVSLTHPVDFRNIVLLSPADLNQTGKNYNFNPSSPHYFIAAGINEPSFLDASLTYAKQLDSLELNYIHYTYNGGHEFNLWLNAYEKALEYFYSVDRTPKCNSGLVEASYPGGTLALNRFFSDNMEYPELAKQMGDQGRAYIQFIIETDSSTNEVKIVKGITPELDKEALRLFSLVPRWIPATKDCEVVRTRYTVPLTFRLD